MHKLTLLLAPLAVLATAACVYDGQEEPEPIANLSTERECFFVSQVNGYNEAPDGPRGDRLYVRTGVRDRFLLETLGTCPDLDWSWQIGIDPNHQSAVCTGDVVDLVIPRTAGGRPDRCSARVLGKMIEEDEG
ncbi:DUF6491 family protein [Aurantiacibacter sp. MUD11]|uniref:DUF6491 family protein n=1 Tax=Aurantiacibacter sp. MUD11 TaxID=3003265 RepID=UPI0022AA80D7|nr:DUF6491 family protein [Aurantiacibacter sp. MUD11]WAT17651.1 DUF6491 family protein [Aurantiacibacter sp. MUD11]